MDTVLQDRGVAECLRESLSQEPGVVLSSKGGAACSAARRPHRLSIGLIKERLIKRVQHTTKMTRKRLPAAADAYEGGLASGYRVATELDLLFIVKGNEARLRFLNLVMGYVSDLTVKQLECTELQDHQVFVNEKLEEFFCEFLRQALLDLRAWSAQALRAGVVEEFDLALARRAHNLRKRMSQESQALTRSVFFTRLQHVFALSGLAEADAHEFFNEQPPIFGRQQETSAAQG